MPEIPELSVVRLTEAVEGIEAGSYGTVVQVYQGSALAETGYAVEFSSPSRVVVVARSQIEPVWTEEDLRAADAKAEELHRYFHPSPVVVDHAERARRVIALVENCAGDTALLVDTVAAEFHQAEIAAIRTENEEIRAANWAWAKKCQNVIDEIAELKRRRCSALLWTEAERDVALARLARLQDDPAVREAVIDALMATGGWVSSFPGELRSVAAALTDAAIAKIEEMLK